MAVLTLNKSQLDYITKSLTDKTVQKIDKLIKTIISRRNYCAAISLFFLVIFNKISVAGEGVEDAAVGDIFDVAGQLLDVINADNPIKAIRLNMPANSILPDHTSGKRIIITETALQIIRLENEGENEEDAVSVIPKHKAFWLENTLSKEFRQVGFETAHYLAILWPEEPSKETMKTQVPCPGELLLQNDYADVCLVDKSQKMSMDTPVTDNTNVIVIDHKVDASLAFVIQIRQH